MTKLNGLKIPCALLFLSAATTVAAGAQTFTTLLSFDGTNGVNPSSFVQGLDGNFYGTTSNGGVNGGTLYGGGTVFRITPAGQLSTIYSFCGEGDCTLEGDFPAGGLVQATNGNFYGTTGEGGAYGNGTVFEITPEGKLTTIHSFCEQARCTDGGQTSAGLIQATNGNLYGTTYGGGAKGDGTVFEITPSGKLTTLHSFDGADGASPFAGLVEATNGNFYGTTYSGGAYGYGTVFEITSEGRLTTLYSFCAKTNCQDGAQPYASLIQATNGNFYGTTQHGGAYGSTLSGADRYGTVFEITAAGTLTTLHSFGGYSSDGRNPGAALAQATDGNLYGTTMEGGANPCETIVTPGCGTVFKITTRGRLTTLHSFAGGFYGQAFPEAGLVQATSGSFYGTTSGGEAFRSNRCPLDSPPVGSGGCGTVFSLAVGLGAFVETIPTSGKAGATVIILGTDLTGATKVSFNGKPAMFTVISHSEIKTTVPAEATTGTVEVTTPSGTLKSNVAFRVP